MALLRGGWNELMIAGFSHRSSGIQNGRVTMYSVHCTLYTCQVHGAHMVSVHCTLYTVHCTPAGIQLASGVIVTRENAHTSGVGEILDRVLVELVTKMQEMAMDKTELGCLRSATQFKTC